MRAAKQDTRLRQDQIAQAALAIIAREGLKGLSVAAVAKQVGIVPSALYRHYRNKAEVLNAVLDLISARLEENVAAVRAETRDPLERIRRLLLRHLQLVQFYQALPRLLFSDEIYGGPPERKAALHRILRNYFRKIGEIVQEGQRQGIIRPDLNTETAALMFMGLVAPSAMLWHLTDGAFDLGRHARRAWKLFRTAVQTPPSRRKSERRKNHASHKTREVVHRTGRGPTGSRILSSGGAGALRHSGRSGGAGRPTGVGPQRGHPDAEVGEAGARARGARGV